MLRSRKTLLVFAFSVAALVGLGSWTIQVKIRAEARETVGQSLIAVRDTTHHALKAWFKEHKTAATIWADATQVRQAARELLRLSPDEARLRSSPAQRELRAWFRPLQKATRYQGYFIVGPGHINVASSRDQNVGVENLLIPQGGFLQRIWAGEAAVSLPVVSDVPLPDGNGRLRGGLPTMFVGAPILDDSGEVIAVFMFRLQPAEGFSSILQQGRIGYTGETYAFDGRGRLISRSRYTDQVRAMGLISPTEQAMLHLHLRDPGANLVNGQRSDVPPEQQPLTRMARSAIRGESAVDLAGYRDYRGVPVVGAWLWDPELNLGITTELDVDEAYKPLRATTQAIVALTVLIILLLLGLVTVYVVYEQRRDAEAALRERDSIFRALVEGIGTDYLIYRQTLDGIFQYATPAIERFTGVPLKRALGRQWRELFDVTQETLERQAIYSANLEKAEETESYETTYIHPDGTIRTVEVTERPELDEHGQPIAILGILKDVTERNRKEQELRRAAAVFDNTDEGILVTDAHQNIVVVNPAFTNITGYEPDEVIGKNPLIQYSDRHDKAFHEEIGDSLDSTGQWRGEIWKRRKNGEVYPAWENISAVRDDRGHVSNYVAVFSDISAIKESQDRLAHLAHHDPLTALPNRLRFMANLEQALETAKRHKHKVALLFLDLDRFKLINDTMGHGYGDKLLQLVADRLKTCVRAEDTVARLGGDEFTIILKEIACSESAALVAEKVVDVIRQPVGFGGEDLSTSSSVGISVYPDDADSSDELVKAADAAMYHAKSRGRNHFQFYTADLTSKAMEHLAMENGLRLALSKGDFILHYQPQVTVSDGRIVGVEALIRWQHPERGLLLPSSFIGVADETDLIDPICEWVLRTAYADLGRWQALGLPPVRIAVNISGRQITNERGIGRLLASLDEIFGEPHALELDLEVTESSMVLVERTREVIGRLKERGVMLAIDDFGTGHSSLSRLKELPVDTLKIDRSFVKDIAEDSDAKAIAAAIIAMAHKLDLRVIGEGVEEKQQVAVLRELGCDEMQGFFYSEPVPAEKIVHLMQRQSAHPEWTGSKALPT